ncbi:MAG: ERAP1-like C-terminal domain-containing protein, partial [Pyrinomonadaceae bacterium]
PSAIADGSDIAARLEKVLLERMNGAATLGLRITFYRAFLNAASTEQSKRALKEILSGKLEIKGLKLKTKDKFDIVTRLLVLGDADAPKLLEDLSKTETSDEAKRYAYAARAGISTAENKQKFFDDFLNNKEISESYIEAAFTPFNSIRHADLTLPYLDKALAELPNLKRNRKIFFVNGWLAAFIGGQRDEKALEIVNKFLADNPNLDRDLRLKVLEVADGLERGIKIRQKFAN